MLPTANGATEAPTNNGAGKIAFCKDRLAYMICVIVEPCMLTVARISKGPFPEGGAVKLTWRSWSGPNALRPELIENSPL
jgi:hypothetical protein